MKNIKLETKTVTGVQESLQVPLIQIINDHPPFTGVTKYSMDLYSCLSINGIRTKLLQYIGGTNQHGYVFSDGINKYGFPIPLPYGHFIGILTGLNRKVKPLEISDNTVVHLSSPTLLQKNKMRVPSVLTVHDLIYKHNPSNSKIFTNFIEHQYKYIDQADIIFADSEYTKGEDR